MCPLANLAARFLSAGTIVCFACAPAGDQGPAGPSPQTPASAEVAVPITAAAVTTAAAAEPGYTIQYAIATLDVDRENPEIIGVLCTTADYRRYVYVFFGEKQYPKLADARRGLAWEPRQVRACIGNDGVDTWYAIFGKEESPNGQRPGTLRRASLADVRQGDAAAKSIPADGTRHAVLNEKTGVWVMQKPDWIVFVELCDQIRRIVGPPKDASLPPGSKYWRSSGAAAPADGATADELSSHTYAPEVIPTEGLPKHFQPYDGGKWACLLVWNKKTSAIENALILWAPGMFFGHWQYPYPSEFVIIGPPTPIPPDVEKSVKWASETGRK